MNTFAAIMIAVLLVIGSFMLHPIIGFIVLFGGIWLITADNY